MGANAVAGLAAAARMGRRRPRPFERTAGAFSGICRQVQHAYHLSNDCRAVFSPAAPPEYSSEIGSPTADRHDAQKPAPQFTCSIYDERFDKGALASGNQ